MRGLAFWGVDFAIWTGFCGGLICAAVNQQSKRLGDLMAGTIVIRTRSPRPPEPIPPVPADLAPWAAQLELSRLSDDLVTASRHLLQRSGGLVGLSAGGARPRSRAPGRGQHGSCPAGGPATTGVPRGRRCRAATAGARQAHPPPTGSGRSRTCRPAGADASAPAVSGLGPLRSCHGVGAAHADRGPARQVVLGSRRGRSRPTAVRSRPARRRCPRPMADGALAASRTWCSAPPRRGPRRPGVGQLRSGPRPRRCGLSERSITPGFPSWSVSSGICPRRSRPR